MRVFVPCEESQVVCMAFRERGHESYSCDVIQCSGGHPEWHIRDDARKHFNDGWDLMIAFPPCTDLAVSGAAWFSEKITDGRQQKSIEFFLEFIDAGIPRIAVENPISIMSSRFRKPDQIIHPYYFGDEFSKPTCLWLKGLPPLEHREEDELFGPKTHVGKGEFVTSKSGKRGAKWNWWLPPGPERAKIRSRTFQGIANAMAEQWG